MKNENAEKIRVIRTDHQRKVLAGGGEIPAYTESEYFYKGVQIAWYDGRDDLLYLRTDLIAPKGKENPMSEYDRALQGEYGEVYRILFWMLGVDKDSELSEFMDVCI